MWVTNQPFPHSVNILFSLHAVKGNVISGPGAKQQKWSVPRSINAITTSTSTWDFSCAKHGKLTIKVRIRIFPSFPVTMWRNKFYNTDLSSIVESIIFAISRQGPKIAFPARVSKKKINFVIDSWRIRAIGICVISLLIKWTSKWSENRCYCNSNRSKRGKNVYMVSCILIQCWLLVS